MRRQIVAATMQPDQFARIASVVAPDATRFERRACPDQYIGQVRDLELTRSITVRRAAESRPEAAGLLVVLESPHIAEFKSDPAPACGTTGLQIARHIREVAGLSIRDDHPITLLNAVRYQCSLGHPPASFRDDVFTAIWMNGGREDFTVRLQTLHRIGDVILCCCTKGKGTDPSRQLRQLVHSAIIECLPLAQVIRCTHPASWHSARNRLHRWCAA